MAGLSSPHHHKMLYSHYGGEADDADYDSPLDRSE